MSQYSCAIVDSNKFFSGILTSFIEQSTDLHLLEVIRNGEDESWANREDIDVLFYDPDVIGPRVQHLLDRLPATTQRIIISSDEEYAIQALMSDVTDFLEKTILTPERFRQTVSLIKSNARERVPDYRI